MVRRRAPIPPAEPWHEARPGLECAYRVDPTGKRGPTPGQVAGRYWRAVGHGWYRPVEPATSVEQRIVDASYGLPAYGGVGGWAALRWWGGRWFEGTRADGSLRDVVLAVGTAHRSHRSGVELTKERLKPDELTVHDGLGLTTAELAVVYEARHAESVGAAVVAIDMACFNDLVSVAEVREKADTMAGWTGIQQVRDALVLATENAWSPQEVTMRLSWTVDTGMGPVQCNRPVFDLDGRHLITPDLLDPVVGVVGEFQGEHHFAREQRRRDLGREALLRDHGLEYVERVAGERHDAFLARLRSTYARAARIPVSDRRWTLELPPGWTPTQTVSQRRLLSERDRARLLAHRAA